MITAAICSNIFVPLTTDIFFFIPTSIPRRLRSGETKDGHMDGVMFSSVSFTLDLYEVINPEVYYTFFIWQFIRTETSLLLYSTESDLFNWGQILSLYNI